LKALDSTTPKSRILLSPWHLLRDFCFLNSALPGQIGGTSNWVYGARSSLGRKLTEFRAWNWGHPPGSWNPSHSLFIAFPYNWEQSNLCLQEAV